MENKWFSNTKCIILCAGKGTRLIPKTLELPKPMLTFEGKPIIEHVINYWKQFTSDFIFIVGYKKEILIDFVKKLPIKSEFIEQKELKGIAHAISLAKESVSDNFIVVLGDCICKGNFNFPENIEQGVGVWKTKSEEDIKRSYSIELNNNIITKVVEKPTQLINNLCGMGFYFFNKKVFSFIDKAEPTPLRNEIEITNIIQDMITAEESISPVFFEGEYLNVTNSKDLK